MTSKIWEFKPVDTFFFRDGTPHNAGEGGGLGVASIFPPYIFTLQGAVRAGLAMGQGWTPNEDKSFPKELGDHDKLGNISFEGPYIKYGNDYLFEVPLTLLHKDLEEFATVVPKKDKYYETDMGKVRLPVLTKSIKGAKTMEDYLFKSSVLERFLEGDKLVLNKEDFFDKSMLWKEENRTGIEIEKSTRSTKQGMLYFTSHIRPKQNVSIVIKVKGIPKNWHKKAPSILNLGGESRMAQIKIGKDKSILPQMPKIRSKSGKIWFTVTLVTPGCCLPIDDIKDIYKNTQDLIKKGYSFIPGNCVSACIGKLRQVGGFNIKKKEPRPLIPIIPPGSTWFYEGDVEDIDILENIHGKTSNSFGFNQIIIGNWGYSNES